MSKARPTRGEVFTIQVNDQGVIDKFYFQWTEVVDDGNLDPEEIRKTGSLTEDPMALLTSGNRTSLNNLLNGLRTLRESQFPIR